MSITIQDAMNRIVRAVSAGPFEKTVDTVKCGDPTAELGGVVVTFTLSFDVIAEAVLAGANLIITHEPTFYSHHDDHKLFADDAVYRRKRELLERYGLTVWRFHDYWHARRPDGILSGMLEKLGWTAYADPAHSPLVRIPVTKLSRLIEVFKKRLSIPYVRVVGDLSRPCSCVGMLLGAMGGEAQIKALAHPDVDVVVCGETVEWMTCEYVRDAAAAGLRKALIVLGHYKSEEAGMEYLADWLKPQLPGVAVRYVPSGDPLVLV